MCHEPKRLGLQSIIRLNYKANLVTRNVCATDCRVARLSQIERALWYFFIEPSSLNLNQRIGQVQLFAHGFQLVLDVF